MRSTSLQASKVPAAEFTFLLGSSDRTLSNSATLLSTLIALPKFKTTSLIACDARQRIDSAS